MVDGARQATLTITETLDLLGFSCTTVSKVTEKGSKKRKYPVSGDSSFSSHYSQKKTQKTISRCTAHQILKQMAYSSAVTLGDTPVS